MSTAKEHSAASSRIRDALAHLHDPAFLETHPLGGLRGKALRRALEDAVDALRPDGKGEARVRRTHELLRLRYLDGLPVGEVQRRLTIRRSEYYREHERAVAALAALLGTQLGNPPSPRDQTLPGAAGNLPSYLTRFLGRDRELADVARCLADGHRLVTLVGPGGTGKTRLAVEIARASNGRWPDGAWFVDLAPLTAPTDGDPTAIAERALAAVAAAAIGQETALAALTRHLAARRALLVVDNCEQVLDATARLAESVVAGCPGMQVLATSREQLGVGGEVVWRLGPLATPPPVERMSADDALGYAAVALFVDRATLAAPAGSAAAFRLDNWNANGAARICQRLDGLPLAIELAAARASVMSVAEIAERLDVLLRTPGPLRTGPSRHRTLHTLIGWSYQLLSEAERTLYRRLAVFAGPFTASAAEAVAGFGALAPSDVVELLPGLAARSLVAADPTEAETVYRLLETIRADAADRLGDSGEEDQALRQHASYFAALNRRLVEPTRPWSTDTAWSRQIEEMRAALGWALAVGDAELALSLVRGVNELNVLGALREARALAEATLALPGADRPELATLRFHALATAALTALRTGDIAGGVAWAEAARALGAAHGLETVGLMVAAYIALWAGDYATHDMLVAPILDVLGGGPYARIVLGDSARAQGDLASAGRWYAEQAERQPEGDPMDPWLLRGLGHLARREGALDEAHRLLARSMAVYRATHAEDRSGQVEVLCGLAGCALDRGDAARAARLASAVETLLDATDSRLYPPDRAELEPVVVAARAALGESAFGAAWESGKSLTLDEAVAEALAVAEMA